MAGSKHTDRVRRLADRLRETGDDDEITGQDLLEAVRVGAVLATGKHTAMTKEEAEEVTPADPPRKPISVAPKSGFPGIVAIVVGGVTRINTWPAAFVGLGIVAVVALWVYLTKR